MTTSTVTRLAALPRVNLLPPEIEEQRRFRRFQAGLGAAVAVAVGVVGLLYVDASGSVTEAQQELDAAQAKTATVNAETRRYAHVPEVYAQVAASEAMLTQAMGKEVPLVVLPERPEPVDPRPRVAHATADHPERRRGGLHRRSVGVGQQRQPARPHGIAQITFRGIARSHDDVATWLEALAKQRGYTNPSFSTSTERYIDATKVVDFTSTMTVTDKALSGRYTQPAGS